jgi:hypothetical protein
MLADNPYVLGWGDVAARNPVILGLDVDAFGEFGGTSEAGASAHGKTV